MNRNSVGLPVSRRRALGLLGAGGCLALLGGCDGGGWHATSIAGSAEPLRFTMTRAADGREVTADDYRGRIAMLYFGYTFCPDVCPLTLANLSECLRRLGDKADAVRVLFATVDPDRDTLPILAQYVANFAPQIDGLRGDPDQLARLARRYRVLYSVKPASDGHPAEVSHSSSTYVFDRTGAARLLIGSLAEGGDLDGITADLRRLVDEGDRPGLLGRLLRVV